MAIIKSAGAGAALAAAAAAAKATANNKANSKTVSSSQPIAGAGVASAAAAAAKVTTNSNIKTNTNTVSKTPVFKSEAEARAYNKANNKTVSGSQSSVSIAGVGAAVAAAKTVPKSTTNNNIKTIITVSGPVKNNVDNVAKTSTSTINQAVKTALTVANNINNTFTKSASNVASSVKQTTTASGNTSTSTYTNTAQIAGLKTTSTGQPIINSASDAQAYYKALNTINNPTKTFVTSSVNVKTSFSSTNSLLAKSSSEKSASSSAQLIYSPIDKSSVSPFAAKIANSTTQTSARDVYNSTMKSLEIDLKNNTLRTPSMINDTTTYGKIGTAVDYNNMIKSFEIKPDPFLNANISKNKDFDCNKVKKAIDDTFIKLIEPTVELSMAIGGAIKYGAAVGASAVGGLVSATVEDVGTAVASVPDFTLKTANLLSGSNWHTDCAENFSNWYNEKEEDIIGDNEIFYKAKAIKSGIDTVVGLAATTTIGGGLTLLGGGGELLGVALDSTGVLAPAGIAINVASVGLVAGGIATIGYGVEVTKNNISNFEYNIEKANDIHEKPKVTGNIADVTYKDEKLDWDSVISKKGETRIEHVNKHGTDDFGRDTHTVFNNDPINTTNDAWNNRNGVTPIDDGMEGEIYNIPHENAGYEGGNGGTKAQQNYVTVIVEKGTNKLITAFPSNGTYGIK